MGVSDGTLRQLSFRGTHSVRSFHFTDGKLRHGEASSLTWLRDFTHVFIYSLPHFRCSESGKAAGRVRRGGERKPYRHSLPTPCPPNPILQGLNVLMERAHLNPFLLAFFSWKPSILVSSFSRIDAFQAPAVSSSSSLTLPMGSSEFLRALSSSLKLHVPWASVSEVSAGSISTSFSLSPRCPTRALYCFQNVTCPLTFLCLCLSYAQCL